MENFFIRVVNFVFKLLLAAIGLVFAACFLLVAVTMLLFGFAKWALTGKKPAPFAAFSQFRQFRQRQRASFNRFTTKPVAKTAPQPDVVDVEMREVRVPIPARSDALDAKSQP